MWVLDINILEMFIVHKKAYSAGMGGDQQVKVTNNIKNALGSLSFWQN